MAVSKFAEASITKCSGSVELELGQLVVTSCFNFAIGKFITGCFEPVLPFKNSFGH